jgi:flagellar motor switch protein FliM
MDKILSQEEVDALLQGVQSGEIETEPKQTESEGIRTYDFLKEGQIIPARLHGLEIITDKFTKNFRNSISSSIMKFVDINIRGIDIMRFGEFMNTIPLPSSINIIKVEPLKGYILIIIDASMIFAFIEHFFGGNGDGRVKIEGRQFTPIEQKIIKKLVSLALTDLVNAWSTITPINAEYVSSEMNPRFVTIAGATEYVVKIEIMTEVEGSKGRLFLCIPYSVIEPIKDKLISNIQASNITVSEECLEQIHSIIMHSSVDVVVEIGEAELTIGDLLALEVGNVVLLNKSTSDELILRVEGVPKFKCLPGRKKGSQAIKITELIKQGG